MKYGPNFKQDMPPEALAQLPEWCVYEGDAEDLRHLKGVLIPTADVERLVYVGEREGIWVVEKDGHRSRPWMGIWITEYDAKGNVVTKGYGDGTHKLPKYGPNAMSTADLSALGMTDSELAKAVKDEFGETYEPDRVGPSDRRRKFFDRLMAKWYR